VVWEGRRALAAGDAALAAGDRSGAEAAWRRAEAWRVPLAPHVAEARARLGGHAPQDAPRRPAPSTGWLAVAVIGLALWLGGAAQFARRGLGEGDRLVRRDAAASAALVAIGLVTWMLGLYNA